MRAIKYRELRRMYESMGPRGAVKELGGALKDKHLRAEDFSIRELAETFLGESVVRDMDPRRGTAVLEAGDGVDSTAFSNITGQLLISRVMESYQNEAFVLSGLIPTVSTRLNGEKIPGMGRIKDETPEVHEGMPYENFGFGEDWVETPATTKRGFIVPVTKEAIFFDRTGLILNRAAEVGEVLGLNKEKRLIDLVIGATNNYKWKGTAYDTYYATGAHPLALTSGGWCNGITDVLSDWSDLDTVEQLFTDILDPHTGEPVLISGMQIITVPKLQHTLRMILSATELRKTINTNDLMITGNPISGYTPYFSRLLYRRLVSSGVAETAAAAAKFWFVGDFRKAFAYMENWPITVTQAPANSEAEFTQDIVARFKVSERGVGATMDPRYVVRSTGAGS